MTQSPSPPAGWLFSGTKDRQSVMPDWQPADRPIIDGAEITEVRHVPTRNGYLTELFRAEWFDHGAPVTQVFQKVMEPGAVSAWHAHALTTDRLFCALGSLLVVLYDGRSDSSTAGRVTEHLVGTTRPTLISVPPGVWHGVKNFGSGLAILINMVDCAYDYADPDHWRVPDDSPLVPYRL